MKNTITTQDMNDYAEGITFTTKEEAYEEYCNRIESDIEDTTEKDYENYCDRQYDKMNFGTMN